MNNRSKRLITGFLLLSLLTGLLCMPVGAGVRTGAAAAAASVSGEASEAAVSKDSLLTPATEIQTPVNMSSATWKKVGSNLRLQSSNGKYKTGFVKYDGSLYYFDSKGNMKVGFFTVDGRTYFASRVQGAKGKGKILTGLYLIDNSYYYYLNPSSKPYAGSVSTGFRTIKGHRYYFDSKGRMRFGWITVGGSKYYGSNNKSGNYGALLTGTHTIGENTYQFDSSGKLIAVLSSASSGAAGKYAHVIDVSQWQGDINFNKVKASGVKAVIIRAGYGENHIDPYFHQNIQRAKSAGLPVGIYWFSYAYTKNMAIKEAKYVLNAIKKYRISLPVYFDWEYDSMNFANKHHKNPSRTLITDMTAAFCSTVTNGGYRAGYYFNLDYRNNHYEPSRLSKYSSWYAYWGTNKPGSNIWAHANTMATPTSFDVWQFTSRGKISGIKGNVDCSLLLNPSIMK